MIRRIQGPIEKLKKPNLSTREKISARVFCLLAMISMPNSSATFSFFMIDNASVKPQVAISACLNGRAVRYDGSSKTLATTTTFLSKALDLLPICPEVGAGMSTPRPPIQLVDNNGQIAAIGRDDKTLNPTAALLRFRQQSIDPLGLSLCGYIFKSRSPSCGVNSTPIFASTGEAIGFGSGLQAAYVQQTLPWLPIREEQQLASEEQCEQFIFQCRLLQDLYLGCQQHGLAAVDRHYSEVINSLPKPSQTALKQSLQTGQKEKYWQELLRALAS